MLQKKNRLTKKKDFDTVFARGNSIKSGFLVVKVLQNHLPDSRFGFMISKKVSPKAVIRNTIRRRLKSIVVGLLPSIKNPVDIVLITLPGVQKQEFAELKESVVHIFKKIP